MQPSYQRPKLLVSFSGTCYPKLSFSIPTDQLVRFGLIAVDSVSLKKNPETERQRSSVGSEPPPISLVSLVLFGDVPK